MLVLLHVLEDFMNANGDRPSQRVTTEWHIIFSYSIQPINFIRDFCRLCWFFPFVETKL